MTPNLLDTLNETGSEHPIYELECFAIFVAVKLWVSYFKHRHMVMFTDNNGSLGAMIKGFSSNVVGRTIVSWTNKLLDDSNTICWFERVNTTSNIADEPSRVSNCSHLGPRDKISMLEFVQHAISEVGGNTMA